MMTLYDTHSRAQHTVREALEGALSTWASTHDPAIAIGWENEAFTPPQDAAFALAYLLPAATEDPSLGAAHRRYAGFLQVNVFAPADRGVTLAQGLAEELEAFFPRGLVLDGVAITRTPVIGRGTQSDLYMVPVFIYYRLDAFT